MRADWVECKLEDVCNINLGQSPPSSTYNTEKIGLPFYQGKAEFGAKYPTPKVWCDSPKKIAEKNDILISVRAPVGATNIANEKCGIGRGLAALSYLFNDFILYFLKFSESKLDSIGTGTTFKAISGEQLRSFNFPLPPLPEQRAIVKKIEALFSSLDAGIADLKKAQDQLKIYRQAVLKKAFEGELTKKWRELNGFSFSLEKIKIKDLGEIVTGNTPSKSDSQNYNSEDFNFYKPTDLNKGLNIHNSTDKVSEFAYEKSRKVYKDSVLVTCIGATIGKTGLIAKEGIFNQQINAIIPNERFNSKFIYFQIIGTDFQNLLIGNSSSTTMPIINKSKFQNLDFITFSKEEQAQIVKEIEARLSVCDAVEQQIKDSLSQAEALRQSILKKAFEGKLLSEEEIKACQQEPDYEPASVLLEKIRTLRYSKGTKKK